MWKINQIRSFHIECIIQWKWWIAWVYGFNVQIVIDKERIQKVQICDKDAKIISQLKLPYIVSDNRKDKEKNKTHGDKI